MYFALACFAALLFVYSLISEKVERLSPSGPIVFVVVGVALPRCWCGASDCRQSCLVCEKGGSLVCGKE